jgi:hypothetical protein
MRHHRWVNSSVHNRVGTKATSHFGFYDEVHF